MGFSYRAGVTLTPEVAGWMNEDGQAQDVTVQGPGDVFAGGQNATLQEPNPPNATSDGGDSWVDQFAEETTLFAKRVADGGLDLPDDNPKPNPAGVNPNSEGIVDYYVGTGEAARNPDGSVTFYNPDLLTTGPDVDAAEWAQFGGVLISEPLDLDGRDCEGVGAAEGDLYLGESTPTSDGVENATNSDSNRLLTALMVIIFASLDDLCRDLEEKTKEVKDNKDFEDKIKLFIIEKAAELVAAGFSAGSSKVLGEAAKTAKPIIDFLKGHLKKAFSEKLTALLFPKETTSAALIRGLIVEYREAVAKGMSDTLGQVQSSHDGGLQETYNAQLQANYDNTSAFQNGVKGVIIQAFLQTSADVTSDVKPYNPNYLPTFFIDFYDQPNKPKKVTYPGIIPDSQKGAYGEIPLFQGKVRFQIEIPGRRIITSYDPNTGEVADIDTFSSQSTLDVERLVDPKSAAQRPMGSIVYTNEERQAIWKKYFELLIGHMGGRDVLVKNLPADVPLLPAE